MYSKLSMRRVRRAGLSDHELKRCRALARGQPWEVWEEDILWWSLDRQSWLPVDDALWPQRRRCLLVQTEAGVHVAMIWQIGRGVEVPTFEEDEFAVEAPIDDLAEAAHE